MLARSMWDAVLDCIALPPRTVSAVGPYARRAAEQRASPGNSGAVGIDLERVPCHEARERGVLLYVPMLAEEVLVVTVRPGSVADAARAALELSMWWVDRSLQAAVPAAGLQCCIRISDLAIERLSLFSSEDSPPSTRSGGTAVGRLRMPRFPFALQLSRLAELRHVQLSPSVRRCVTELDVRSCLQWHAADVNAMLDSLQSPLRGVRVMSCCVSPRALLNRFFASLRVLHLFRRSGGYRDANRRSVSASYEDEEYEEEESVQTPSPPPTANSVATSVSHGNSPPRHSAPSMTPLPPSTSGAATPVPSAAPAPSANSQGARPARPRRPRLSPAVAAGAVLDELFIVNSARRALPRWVESCGRLRYLSLRNCAYESLDVLRNARSLTTVFLEGCDHFARYELFSAVGPLHTMTIRNCAQLRDLSWLPRLSGALRTLYIHHLSPLPLTTFASAAALGVGLSGLRELHLSVPSLLALRPLVSHAARTLRDLTLFTCINLNNFNELPALPALERVTITGNRHMRNFFWLANSPHVVELRATQCIQLSSLTGLDALSQLRVLDLSGSSQIRTIAPLAECTALEYIDISQCGLLTRVSALEHLPLLQVVFMRNCTSLVRDFRWIEACPLLEEVMVPGHSWIEPAARVLRRLHRTNVLLR